MVTNKQNKLKPKKLSFDNLPSDDDAEDEEEEYMMVGRRIHGNSMIAFYLSDSAIISFKMTTSNLM